MEAVWDIQMAYSWKTQLYSHCFQNHSIKPRASCKSTEDKSNSQLHWKCTTDHRTTGKQRVCQIQVTQTSCGISHKAYTGTGNMTTCMEFVLAAPEWLPYQVGNVPAICNCDGKANGGPSKKWKSLLLPSNLITKWDVCLVFVCKEKPSPLPECMENFSKYRISNKIKPQ